MGKVICILFFGVVMVNAITPNGGTAWINIRYIECLKNKLPCDCEKDAGLYSFISLDMNNNKIMLNGYSQMEPYVYLLKVSGLNKYEIVNWDNNIVPIEIFIQNDTLHLIAKQIELKFIQSYTIKNYDFYHYAKDNINLLNQAFELRGYSKLEQIVGYDSLCCDCNPWLEFKNLLSVQGMGKHWILKLVGDSLHIMKVINNENIDLDDELEVERMYVFKWDISPASVLNQEVDHALQHDQNPINTHDAKYSNKEEKRVIEGTEQTTARKHGEIKKDEVTRTDHGGRGYETKGPTTTEGKYEVVITAKKKTEE
jgi:hypothetical protein